MPSGSFSCDCSLPLPFLSIRIVSFEYNFPMKYCPKKTSSFLSWGAVILMSVPMLLNELLPECAANGMIKAGNNNRILFFMYAYMLLFC